MFIGRVWLAGDFSLVNQLEDAKGEPGYKLAYLRTLRFRDHKRLVGK
jgi:hypothetical protein